MKTASTEIFIVMTQNAQLSIYYSNILKIIWIKSKLKIIVRKR